MKFTFIGRIGVVTAVDNEAVIPMVWVSFNYGRTSYQFEQSQVELETRSKSMYGKFLFLVGIGVRNCLICILSRNLVGCSL